MNILGTKIINPIISAVMALINTPLADKSLIFFIISCFSGHMKFAICSTEEFIISRLNTSPIEKTMAIHSFSEILKISPAIIMHTVANRWILALCSSFIKIRNPLKAYLKLFSLFNMANCCCFIL